jgi:hypothetical protein
MSGWVDGVHLPRCVEWRWCVLPLSCPVLWCGSCPTHPIAVLASTAVRVVYCPLPGAVVCGWWVCVCAVRVVGYPLCAPPSQWWRVGPLWMVGCCRGWWVAWWVKGGSVTDSPSNVGVPLVVYPVALLNGVRCMCCDALSSDWAGTLHCPTPSRIVQSPSSLCVCCHSIVGLGLCLCDRVVSLWNSGGDCVG